MRSGRRLFTKKKKDEKEASVECGAGHRVHGAGPHLSPSSSRCTCLPSSVHTCHPSGPEEAAVVKLAATSALHCAAHFLHSQALLSICSTRAQLQVCPSLTTHLQEVVLATGTSWQQLPVPQAFTPEQTQNT